MKTISIKRISSAAVLGLAVLFASCDSASDMTSPNKNVFGTPQFSATGTYTAVNGGPIAPIGDGGGEPEFGGVLGGAPMGDLGGGTRISTSPTAVKITSKNSSTTLNAAGATLVIPANAMPNGTTVTMNVNPLNRFEVSLTATSRNSSVLNDVGAAGFSQPVKLYIDYGATPPPSSYGIAWLQAGGLVPMPSSIQGTSIVGELSHFSTYVVSEYVLQQ